MLRLFFLTIIYFLFLLNSFAQTGQPFIKNYPPYTIGANGGQIWSIVQDAQGIMYFGGNDGIYEFDGQSWRKIELAKKYNSARALTINDKGKIFVGSVGDFGYLSPDKSGNLKYISLVNKVDSADRYFTDIWTTFADKNTVYFCANNMLFRYNEDSAKQIKVIKDKYFFLMYKPRNEIFVSVSGEGLMKLKDDKLISLNLPEKLFPYQILPYDKDKYLICGTRKGLLVYDPNAKNENEILTKDKFLDSEELKTTNQILAKNHIYTGGTVLKDGNFAIGTVQNGIFIINNKGKIIQNLNKEKGLLSQTVHTLYNDTNGQLWAGLTYGISYLELNSAITQFNEKNGIQGSIYNVIKFKDKLYVNSNLGIYYFNENEFTGVKNLYEHGLQVFNPIIVKSKTGEEHFLVSTVRGMYEIKNLEAIPINNISPSTINIDQTDSSKIFITSDFALLKFKIEGEKFTHPDTIHSFPDAPLIIAQNNSKLWILEGEEIILFDTSTKKKISFEKNNELKGIEFNGCEKINNENIFYTNKGTFVYRNEKFINSEDISADFNNKAEILQFQHIDNNIVSILKINDIQKLFISDFKNKKFIDTISYKRLSEFESFFIENKNAFWIIAPNSVYKFNPEFKREYKEARNCLIRNIKIGRDSVIFHGNSMKISGNDTIAVYNKYTIHENPLSYDFNDITFTVSLPSFEGETGNLYSYRLKGSKNKKWSNWTNSNIKEYTNLSEGKYIFQVKAKNIYDFESEITEFEFYVRPPYYRSALAYILYIILIGFILYGTIKLNSSRLEAENKRLDNIVKERTSEIMQQNEEIQTQAENLKEINEALSQRNEEINQQNEEIRTIADNLQAANDEITSINESISEKNKHIRDSINYARRIQKAMLIGQESIKQIIPEHFILLEPKDVVSGDFYWYNKINSHVVFAAVDCTGHGVPGAFMSMLGYAFLNEIVITGEVTHASQVLDLLRKNIIKTLHQTGESSSRDGMDIAFFALNLETNTLQYAGAHNPIFIIRQSGFKKSNYSKNENIFIYEDKLLEIKADRMPIGYNKILKPFKNHIIKLKKDDIIYIFSDGFVDQTGGEKGRKYMIKRFRELILNIYNKKMPEQHDLLINEFNNWKATQNQLDDVLIVGLKFDMLNK